MDAQDVQVQAVRLENVVYLFPITILYYDHLLTLDSEVKFIWKRHRNFSAYLFLINRYFAFFGNIVAGFSSFPSSLSLSNCISLELFYQIFLEIRQGMVFTLLSLRVYALYGCRRSLLVVLLSISLGGTLTSIIVSGLLRLIQFPIIRYLPKISCFHPAPSTQPEQLGCHVLLETQNAAKTSAIGWEGVFGFDVVLFSMTVLKAYQIHHEMKASNSGMPLFSMLIRDGTIYFFFMALANFVNIIMFYSSGPFEKGSLAPFASCLSVTLMSRLMLNLHEAANGGLYISYADTLSLEVWRAQRADTVISRVELQDGNYELVEM